MPWVVDTCVLVDVLENDPEFGRASAGALAAKLAEGLVVSPITYVELAPAFNGSVALQDEFLTGVGVDWNQGWSAHDTQSAHRAWAAHIGSRRAGNTARRPVADILIGAYACRFEGLITRNPKDFRHTFPSLALVNPSSA